MKYRRWIFVVALAFPVMAQAQRGGGRGRGGSTAGMDESGPASDNGIKAKDVEKLNPATVILAKAKDLKLDDAQRTQLTDIAKRYEWNANVFARVADSLRNVVDARRGGRGRGQSGAAGGNAPEVEKTPEEIMAARKTLATTLVNIRAEYDTAAARSLNALTVAQRPKAGSLLDKPLRDLTEILHKAGGP